MPFSSWVRDALVRLLSARFVANFPRVVAGLVLLAAFGVSLEPASVASKQAPAGVDGAGLGGLAPDPGAPSHDVFLGFAPAEPVRNGLAASDSTPLRLARQRHAAFEGNEAAVTPNEAVKDSPEPAAPKVQLAASHGFQVEPAPTQAPAEWLGFERQIVAGPIETQLEIEPGVSVEVVIATAGQVPPAPAPPAALPDRSVENFAKPIAAFAGPVDAISTPIAKADWPSPPQFAKPHSVRPTLPVASIQPIVAKPVSALPSLHRPNTITKPVASKPPTVVKPVSAFPSLDPPSAITKPIASKPLLRKLPLERLAELPRGLSKPVAAASQFPILLVSGPAAVLPRLRSSGVLPARFTPSILVGLSLPEIGTESLGELAPTFGPGPVLAAASFGELPPVLLAEAPPLSLQVIPEPGVAGLLGLGLVALGLRRRRATP